MIRFPLVRTSVAGALIAALCAPAAFAQDSASYRSAPRRLAPKKPKVIPVAVAPVEAPAAALAPPVAPAAPAAPVTPPNPPVGGAEMDQARTIVENASAAPNLTTLVRLVQAADLVPTLSGPGPFTVFAPTDEAFGRLPAGTIDALAAPEYKPKLVEILTYHVVPGTITIEQLKAQITAGGGKAALTTVQGKPISATLTKNPAGDVLTLTSAIGNIGYIEIGDVRQSNGIVHVINGVLSPTP